MYMCRCHVIWNIKNRSTLCFQSSCSCLDLIRLLVDIRNMIIVMSFKPSTPLGPFLFFIKITLTSCLLTLGKSTHKKLGVTLKDWQLRKKLRSNSALRTFLDVFSNLRKSAMSIASRYLFAKSWTILPKKRNNSKCMINLTKMTTLLSLKTEMFQQLQLPLSELYKNEWK